MTYDAWVMWLGFGSMALSTFAGAASVVVAIKVAWWDRRNR